MGGKRKKRPKSLVLAGIAVLVVVGCIENAAGQSHHNYFPLSVGNSWTYKDANGMQETTFTIIDTKEINGHTYYKFDDYVSVCGFPGFEPNSPAEDSNTLFRYEPYSDRVLQYWPSIKEDRVRYDFSQDMWGEGGNQLTETGLSCMVPVGDFNDCCKFQFAMNLACGDFNEILAPGVGNIAFETTPTGGFELQSYTIVSEPYCGDPNHPYPVGDLNQDCRVEFADFAVMAGHWLEHVNLEPVVYIGFPPDGYEFCWLTLSVQLVAGAWDVDGSVVKVQFYANGAKWGSEASYEGNNSWVYVTAFDVGTYILTAEATDNEGATAVSAPVTITALPE